MAAGLIAASTFGLQLRTINEMSWCKLSSFHGLVKLVRASGIAPSQQRWLHTGKVLLATEGEERLAAILTDKLNPTYVNVRDVSGGCGSMYEITIDSEMFDGKRLVNQHRLINEALGAEVRAMHGLIIKIGKPEETG